ncbi:MAG: DoxX family membrane protein [Candidatus Nanohaloarchaea archaeon]
MEFETDRFFEYGDEVALYGISLVFLLAGLSKFALPELWKGYIPRFLYYTLPLWESQLSYAAGVFELAAGALLATKWRPRLVATLMTFWMLGITASVAAIGMWTIALRDLGLAALAYKVATDHSGL